MKNLNRFCWLLILTTLIAYGVNRYYVPTEPLVQLDEWGEPVIQYDNLGIIRDDVLTLGAGNQSLGPAGRGNFMFGVRNDAPWTDGDYSAINIDSVGALWTDGLVPIVNDDFGSSWSTFMTTEQGYLQCENIDKEKWALIPKEELDKFKAYLSRQLR